MRMLTKNVGESIMINDAISVTVLGVNGSHVRLGVTAPPQVAVYREENFKKIRAKKKKPA